MRDLVSSGHETAGQSDPIQLDPRQRAWLEVSPAAVDTNVRALRRLLDPACALMAVVKADGYGHGAATVARAACMHVQSSEASAAGPSSPTDAASSRDAADAASSDRQTASATAAAAE